MRTYDTLTTNGSDINYTIPTRTAATLTPRGTLPDPPDEIDWWAWRAAWAELAADCPPPIGLYADDSDWNPKPSARRIVMK